ncbi:GTP cyclohydrolase II [Saccharophagus degradans]|uniref:GTP cyclohydrolase-2 n=2 Tax=Saccharophagus degradans TaxID=86304 RepID=RIBA_SACD2|nr:GTP cyclohydrolase II [Saccharophagus degradans]Q21F24.1 RecName: Full=GTP cyclohydrolase-2; AltName: Full=GTP cyclohydrolase II [Saccharophagus degradans 2-40]ABD82705.1 GTP cyclohydrolase II [Saccharophagus degradans 2-40]MBU2986257.1 GTP cyclohydrolase II [Saccharophagus degradans]MDO6424299.1 GTP cyclohydrolase II [Saccharophagus degradans]MDO6608494.1 GTP cyclohydrolase II [Saccharophagus degradans]WGO99106.1 GTP cyclohydrolase II [Saccharophagus degradans]
MTVKYVESSKLPTPMGMFAMHGFSDDSSDKEHVVLTMGDVSSEEPVLVRIHSECLTGDALFSLRCDCGAQLQAAMHKIAIEGRGAIFYLRQEGRGIGLLNKIRAYKLQDCGADTVEANERLGFGADMRDYSILKPMFEHLGIAQVKLMTNNPRKIDALTQYGINIVNRIPHETGRNPHNADYLETKKGKLGHMFGEKDGE